MKKVDAMPLMSDTKKIESTGSCARLSYELIDLIVQCDLNEPEPADLAAWNDMPPVGRESSGKQSSRAVGAE